MKNKEVGIEVNLRSMMALVAIGYAIAGAGGAVVGLHWGSGEAAVMIIGIICAVAGIAMVAVGEKLIKKVLGSSLHELAEKVEIAVKESGGEETNVVVVEKIKLPL